MTKHRYKLLRSTTHALVVGDAEVVVDGGPGISPFLARFFLNTLPQPYPTRSGLPQFPGVTGFVGQQPVPELGVILVRVEERVRAIRLHHLAGRDGVCQPP